MFRPHSVTIMSASLEQLVTLAAADFAAATEPAQLEDAKARYLGKDGSLTTQLKALGKLPRMSEKRPVRPLIWPSRPSSRR